MPHPTPTEAWQRLKAGNERFASEMVDRPHQSADWRKALTSAQEPHAVIFGCSDSRLAAELIFDVGLGDVFVIRTAGQVIDDAVLGSLEFSVDELNIPLVIVLGHDSCGAVTAAVDAYNSGALPRRFLRSLVERITPSVISARHKGITDVDGTVVEHTNETVHRIVDTCASLSEAIAAGKTAVMGVTYSLENGTVKVGDVVGPIDPKDY